MHILNLSYLLDLSLEEAGSKMLDEAAKVETTMNDLKLSKIACCSRIEIDNKVHCFVASGKDHLKIREIYAKLDQSMDKSSVRIAILMMLI